MTRLAASGLSIELPPGWEAEIYRRSADAAFGLLSHGETAHSVLHAGNFPLPPDRGDFGSGAVEIMRADEVLIVLFEHHPSGVGTPLFRHEGLPIPLDIADFDREMMQRPLSGQAGLQRFFTAAGRAFCLYVVLGSALNRSLVDQANALLTQLRIE